MGAGEARNKIKQAGYDVNTGVLLSLSSRDNDQHHIYNRKLTTNLSRGRGNSCVSSEMAITVYCQWGESLHTFPEVGIGLYKLFNNSETTAQFKLYNRL